MKQLMWQEEYPLFKSSLTSSLSNHSHVSLLLHAQVAGQDFSYRMRMLESVLDHFNHNMEKKGAHL